MLYKPWHERGCSVGIRSRRHGELKNHTVLVRADAVQDQVYARIRGATGGQVVLGAAVVRVAVCQAGCVMAWILAYKLDQGSAVRRKAVHQKRRSNHAVHKRQAEQ